MKTVVATLEYEGKQYSVQHKHSDGYEDYALVYIWTEGNYACDCNRAMFIQAQCNKKFLSLPCGEEIKLVKLTIDGEEIEID